MRERLGQPAGFVELDVDGIVAPAEAIQVASRMQRFIGTHRDFAADLSQRGILACGERLLDELEPGVGGSGHEVRQHCRRPGLVGVGNQPCL